jgi:NAD-reducing hydrogenase small subunit
MGDKITIASDWLGGCSGCHMSLLDIDERLVGLLEKATLHATPITDLKQPPEQGVEVGILEGTVTNSAQEEVAHRMRRRCRCLVALGDCAVFGGIPTLRNRRDSDAALRRAYIESETTDRGNSPTDEELATMVPARPLRDIVDVDIDVPGCPPSPEVIFHVLCELAAGRIPKLAGPLLDWH